MPTSIAFCRLCFLFFFRAPQRRSASSLLLALAFAFGVAPPAFAQGSVTLYGLIDTSIEVTNPGSGYVARMDSGAYRGTRFGLHGTEPLGDGNSLVFTLENGFDSATGEFSVPGSIFNRQAWIGAHGAWGELRVGRQYSPIYIPFKGQLDAFGAGTIASGLNNLSKITPYTDNAFAYLSPTIAGLTVTGMYALRDPGDGNGIGGYYGRVGARRHEAAVRASADTRRRRVARELRGRFVSMGRAHGLRRVLQWRRRDAALSRRRALGVRAVADHAAGERVCRLRPCARPQRRRQQRGSVQHRVRLPGIEGAVALSQRR
ncbi:exported hypothetical protein [Paraburkholderia sabiae]|nr:exported hypothetical protein [Paraburkholderia sabiae]